MMNRIVSIRILRLLTYLVIICVALGTQGSFPFERARNTNLSTKYLMPSESSIRLEDPIIHLLPRLLATSDLPIFGLLSSGSLDSPNHPIADYQIYLPVLTRPDPPVAQDDSFKMDENSIIFIKAPGIISNDSYSQGSSPRVIVVTDVTNGTLTLHANGSFVYSPDSSFIGIDSFSYILNDGYSSSEPALVNIDVQPCTRCYFVDRTNGSDSYPGNSRDHAWRTIQKAANTMVGGDKVTVLSGNYNEYVEITRSGAADSSITFLAEGSVVMNGFDVQANFITIKGFEITNTPADWRGYGIRLVGSHCIFEDNYIHWATRGGILLWADPGQYEGTSNNVVRNNHLNKNAAWGIEVNGNNNLIEGNEISETIQHHPSMPTWDDADGMRFFGSGNIFRKNYIHDISYGLPGFNPAIGDYNDNPHIDCFQTWTSENHEVGQNSLFEQNICDNLTSQNEGQIGSGFMLGGGANNLTIRNNILRVFAGVNTAAVGGANHLYFYNNLWIGDLTTDQSYTYGLELVNATYSIVKNNIFYNQPHHTVMVYNDSTGVQVDYNAAYNSDGSIPDCVQYDHCVYPAHDLWNVDPRFVNPNADDFHLLLESPVIDTGIMLNAVSNDLDDSPRPEGSGYDIGPYEYLFGG